MTAPLSKAERARRLRKQYPEWTARDIADHLKTHIQVVYDALERKNGARRGRPPAPAHKKRNAKRQLKLTGVSTKRKAK